MRGSLVDKLNHALYLCGSSLRVQTAEQSLPECLVAIVQRKGSKVEVMSDWSAIDPSRKLPASWTITSKLNKIVEACRFVRTSKEFAAEFHFYNYSEVVTITTANE